MLEKFAEVGRFFEKARGFWAYGYCIFLGVVSALAFPPYPFIPLFFVAIVLVLLLLSGEERVSKAFHYGFFFGIGQFGFGLSWISNSFAAQGDVPTWMAPIMVSFLVVALSFFPALAFMITRLLWHNNWFQRAMAFAALYGLFEFLRGWDFIFAFPWNPTSLIWWPSDIMLQSLSLGGSYALGLLTILAAGFFTALFDGKASLRHRLVTPALGLVILFGLAGFGALKLNNNPTSYKDDLVIRLVQPNIPQVEKWERSLKQRNLERHIALSIAPAGPLGRPDIIIWSETAVPYNLEEAQNRRAILSYFPDQILLAGASRRVLEPTPELTNSLYALEGEGDILGRYDKSHLVPFGEYLPLRATFEFFGLDTLAPGSTDYDSGPGIRTLTIDGVPSFSPLVCYEIIFSGKVMIREERPDWIINITNDAWFGDSPGPRQHFQMARARAIEEGIPVLRVAGTGISAVIDPYGRVLSKIELGEEGFLDTRLPEKTQGLSVFATFGVIPVGALALLFFIIGAPSGLSERSRKEENT
ncbi:MAG: apolipoprotein N-acyltransferase [Sphingomonadales bacterium]